MRKHKLIMGEGRGLTARRTLQTLRTSSPVLLRRLTSLKLTVLRLGVTSPGFVVLEDLTSLSCAVHDECLKSIQEILIGV